MKILSWNCCVKGNLASLDMGGFMSYNFPTMCFLHWKIDLMNVYLWAHVLICVCARVWIVNVYDFFSIWVVCDIWALAIYWDSTKRESKKAYRCIYILYNRYTKNRLIRTTSQFSMWLRMSFYRPYTRAHPWCINLREHRLWDMSIRSRIRDCTADGNPKIE